MRVINTFLKAYILILFFCIYSHLAWRPACLSEFQKASAGVKVHFFRMHSHKSDFWFQFFLDIVTKEFLFSSQEYFFLAVRIKFLCRETDFCSMEKRIVTQSRKLSWHQETIL